MSTLSHPESYCLIAMTTPSHPTFEPGDILVGKYCVERVLGKGGMGAVVAVRHVHLGELFAIKIMLPEMLEHPEAVGRFLREAQASARLRGEHVARVHDVGTLESGVPYMVLEYLEGNDLDHLLTTRGALGLGEAAAYVHQVCEALIEAHGQGIVHRDLKPANLFLTRRANGSACIKVLDFGISKDMTGANQLAPKLTQTGAIMGSPHYMSPEQLIDSKNVDPRSDIWALGIILYELVTGTVPFNAETMPEIIAKVLSMQPLPASKLRMGISPAFDALLGRCIEKNRDVRFQSVQEFMAALKPFVNENDTKPAGPIRLVPLGSSDASSAVAKSAATWGQETALAPTSGTHSSRRTWPIVAAIGVFVAVGVGVFFATKPQDPNQRPDPEQPATSAADAKPVVPTSAPVDVPATPSASTATSPAATVATTTAVAAGSRVLSPIVSAVTTATAAASATTKTKKKVKGFDE